MKKILLGAGLVVVLGGYALWSFSRTNTGTQVATLPTTNTTPPPTNTPTPPPVTTPPVTTPPPAPAPTGAFKDGTYKGNVANAYYGMLQVSAVIVGGKLTNVKFLQYPNESGETAKINQRAMPKLTQEAIAAQSAKVDNISGATQTVDAFKESLQNALTQAKA